MILRRSRSFNGDDNARSQQKQLATAVQANEQAADEVMY